MVVVSCGMTSWTSDAGLSRGNLTKSPTTDTCFATSAGSEYALTARMTCALRSLWPWWCNTSHEVLLDFAEGTVGDDGLELVYAGLAAHALDEGDHGLEGLGGGLEARLDL